MPHEQRITHLESRLHGLPPKLTQVSALLGGRAVALGRCDLGEPGLLLGAGKLGQLVDVVLDDLACFVNRASNVWLECELSEPCFWPWMREGQGPLVGCVKRACGHALL
jgi:hypothetical protein